jgi:nucleotide-binding universal stress UspA family protein
MTSIVAVLSDPTTAPACLDAAAVAAAAIPEGRVEAFHARVKPESFIMVSEEVMTAERRAELIAMLDEKSRRLHEVVAEWIADNAVEEAPVWNESEGDRVEAIVATRGKTADLVVIVRPGEIEGEDALHAAIFETGRLLLLVPPIPSGTPFGRHVAIAWKASNQAERALTASVPWLKRAERVSVLLVSEGDTSPGDALALLEPHGIRCEPMLMGREHDAIGARLLRAAHDIGADCLVMGSYRHNRLVEFILGGVTRHMLQHADLPLFMMH